MFFLRFCGIPNLNSSQSLLVILSLIRAFSKASLEGKYAGKVGKYVQLHIIFFSVYNPSVAIESANHYIHTRLLLTRNICTWKEQVWTKIPHNYCTGKKFDNNLTAPSGNFPSWSSLPWLVPLSPSLSEIKKNMNIHLFLSFAFIFTFSFSLTS